MEGGAKRRREDEVAEKMESVEQKLISRFTYERTLHEDTDRKTIYLLGTIAPKESPIEENPTPTPDVHGTAVVILSRVRWGESKEYIHIGKPKGIEVVETFNRPQSDTPPAVPSKWSRFKARLNTPEQSGVLANVSVLCPATEEDIKRFTGKQLELIKETPQEWQEVTRTLLPTRNPTTFFDSLQENKAGELGQQYIVHEDSEDESTGFLVIADPRWKRTQPLALNCIVLPLRKDITSLRDIQSSHLPLLHNIRKKLPSILYQKFKIWADRLCLFAEYPPRSNRFYLRGTQSDNRTISTLSDEIPDDLAPHGYERTQYVLDDIIENVELVGDYYQKKTLSYHVYRYDDLHLRLCAYRWFGRKDGTLAICDFHCHSRHSDGKLTVEEIMTKAHKDGLKIFALTDHDNMEGVPKAIELGHQYGIRVIPGVEISTETESGENIHVLGYFPIKMSPEENAALQGELAQIREARYTRGKGMLEKLAQLDIHLEWERVLELAGEAAPGRPHVADALVEKGYVSDFRAAFDLYLGQDKPAFVQGRRFPPEDAVKLIRRLRGFSVLAHPWCCKDPIPLIKRLAPIGLQGMEVYTGISTLREEFIRLAEENGLFRLGGSDFHGRDHDEENRLGNLPLPDDMGEWMFTHASEGSWPTHPNSLFKEPEEKN